MFDLVIVGEGGGPDETNLSAYLFKPSAASWEDGIVALEAGSGQGAVQKLLEHDPHLFNSLEQSSSRTKPYSASEIYSLVRCFLISHAHLDHVNSLVISAGSLGGPRKRLFAAKQTLEDLESVFSDRIWPNLASWSENDDNHKLLYSAHGHNEAGNYDSAAFFIRYDPTGHEFLFFGDVEPDSISRTPQTINVWLLLASARSDDTLYGHLKPEHLVSELEVLATEVVKVRNGGRVSGTSARPTVIIEQIKSLVEAKGLGVEILAARQGMCVPLQVKDSSQ
ncbi:hypothetical protein B0H10DRAFT_2164196 [Mycena sp. CBHHK59/15]|nr:hypothetical protein B0H10DRAFT_2164196 [Mycena sp. CBHHK59/15]